MTKIYLAIFYDFKIHKINEHKFNLSTTFNNIIRTFKLKDDCEAYILSCGYEVDKINLKHSGYYTILEKELE